MTERYDLHIHSNISDGTQPLTELVPLIRDAGLAGFALTDHDTARGWPQAAELAGEYGLDFLPGGEFSCRYSYRDEQGHERTKSVHLLGYGYDPDYPQLRDEMKRLLDDRLSRARRMADRLAADYPLTWDDVLAQSSDGENTVFGRPHLADALVAVGAAENRADAFDNILHVNGPYHVHQQSMDPLEAIRLVRAAGGVPVVAHPMSEERGPALPLEYLGKMVEAGLAGVEVYHRENSEPNRVRLLEFARERELLVTGSSDYHGVGKPNQLGEYTTSRETVEAIRAQISR